MIYSSKTLVKNSEIYHYKFSELKEFITRGKKDGNVGFILISKINGFNKYKGFGTIENPLYFIQTITMLNHPLFDDNHTSKQSISDYKFVILNLNNES